jgi:hypothetical protein
MGIVYTRCTVRKLLPKNHSPKIKLFAIDINVRDPRSSMFDPVGGTPSDTASDIENHLILQSEACHECLPYTVGGIVLVLKID